MLLDSVLIPLFLMVALLPLMVITSSTVCGPGRLIARAHPRQASCPGNASIPGAACDIDCPGFDPVATESAMNCTLRCGARTNLTAPAVLDDCNVTYSVVRECLCPLDRRGHSCNVIVPTMCKVVSELTQLPEVSTHPPLPTPRPPDPSNRILTQAQCETIWHRSTRRGQPGPAGARGSRAGRAWYGAKKGFGGYVENRRIDGLFSPGIWIPSGGASLTMQAPNNTSHKQHYP